VIRIKNYHKIKGIIGRRIGVDGNQHTLEIQNIIEDGDSYKMKGMYKCIQNHVGNPNIGIQIVLSKRVRGGELGLKIQKYGYGGGIDLYEESGVSINTLTSPVDLIHAILLEIIPKV
jgi:hypothetical protein